MFFHLDLKHTIKLRPEDFNAGIRQKLRAQLIKDVEGTCNGQYGYIICVLDDNDLRIPPGTILPGQGIAEFHVTYRAVVWKPFKNEVVDATVSVVNKMGFFADAGPVSVFVSTHLLPPEMKFDPTANPPNYSGEDSLLQKGSKVRLRIVGTRTDATEIYAIGTMKEDYLGVL